MLPNFRRYWILWIVAFVAALWSGYEIFTLLTGREVISQKVWAVKDQYPLLGTAIGICLLTLWVHFFTKYRQTWILLVGLFISFGLVLRAC